MQCAGLVSGGFSPCVGGAMKRVLVTLLGVVVSAPFAAAQVVDDKKMIERQFAEGGCVELRLASGDYTLRAGDADRIVVRWSAGDEARVKDLRKMSVDVHVDGRNASVLTEGPSKHVHFTIEMPARSDVFLRMKAGDVEIQGIDGNKDIRMTAGDLTIGVRPSTLWYVHGSVTFGDIDARPLGIDKGGIKRSFEWIGGGKYTLDARVFAGDLKLASGKVETVEKSKK
jgi:hypothetical protein